MSWCLHTPAHPYGALCCAGKRRYNIKLWKTFTDCFNCLPIAAIIDDKIFTMHGGLSPELASMDQIKRIMRPTDVPDTGLLCDLLWSDPDKDIVGWGENDRGVSFTFGHDVVSSFLKRHDLDLICRAHQVVEDGYEFFAKRELRKQARERAENGYDAQITLDIEAAPAQIALLQLEVGSQKKTIDVLHRIVDVMKKAAEASRKAFQKQADELRQLLTSQRPSPSILPV